MKNKTKIDNTNNNLFKYSFQKILAVFLTLCIILSFTGCSFFSNDNNFTENNSTEYTQPTEIYADEDNAEFAEYIDGLFRETVAGDALTLHSYLQNPANYGITDYEVTLGGYDVENLDYTQDITDSITALKSFNRETLSQKQQITYDQLLKYMETQLEYCDLYLFDTCLSTTVGLQVQLPIIFAEYSFNAEKDVVDYIKLLEDTDNFFQNIVDYETIRSENGYFMEAHLAEEIITQCRTFVDSADDGYLISTFDERIDKLSGISDEAKQAYKEQNTAAVNEHVIKGYQILADGLTKLKNTGKYSGGLVNYPNGKKYYESLVNMDMGWSKTIEEYDTLLDEYISQNILTMQMLMAKEPDLLDKFDSFSFSVTEPKDILNDLKTKIAQDFPTGPEINFDIKYITEALQDFASPAMYFTPQLDNLTNNSIYINPSSTNASELYPTLAHEGYPGHMYQITYFAASNPDLIRFLIEPGGFIEGWATYCEMYSYTLADKENLSLSLLNQANYITILCMYAKVDIGVNYHGWTAEQVYQYIKTYGYDDMEIAENMYYSMVSEPANYCQYVLGYIAFNELKETAQNKLDDRFNLKEFHKFILDLGPVQFDILFDRLEGWVNK